MEDKSDFSLSETKGRERIPKALDFRFRPRPPGGRNCRYHRIPGNSISRGSLPIDLADWLHRKTDDQGTSSGSFSAADDTDSRGSQSADPETK
jgi:hypothetical protein